MCLVLVLARKYGSDEGGASLHATRNGDRHRVPDPEEHKLQRSQDCHELLRGSALSVDRDKLRAGHLGVLTVG